MSHEFTEHVVVLKVGIFREADCWVRVLSPSKGVLTGFAFGGMRSRRRFCGCLDAVSKVQFRFQSSKRGKYLTLCEGALLDRYAGIRQLPGRLGMAVNCLKFVEAVQIGAHGASEVFALLSQVLRLLDAHSALEPVLPIFFRARVAFEHGYQPELDRCLQCGAVVSRDPTWAFVLRQGGLVCSRCRRQVAGPVAPLALEQLDMLRRILLESPEKWPVSAPVCDQEVQQGVRLLDQYVQFHLGVTWDGNRFVRN
ncbi:MAG: DNA repair protein RecO [Thermodesulfobacteriota bacterium]